ncbi:MAG: dioxygenase [Kofleriaceae bacterium]
MTDFDDAQLTEAVRASFAAAPDPRVRAVLGFLIDHLHGFLRDSALTFDEWRHAIDFLTRTGQLSSATRQEFILLSDVLGASMLVDAINHRDHAGVTDSTVLGPFYVGEHRLVPDGTDLAPGAPGAPGARLLVAARVTDPAGAPIAATIDVWHADAHGFYDSQHPGYTVEQPALRARFAAGADGRFTFRTIVPCSYPVPTDGPVGELLRAANRHAMRPAHIHFLLRAPGFETLVTHVFVAGDDYLTSDAVFGAKPALIAPLEPHDEPGWHRLSYHFVLKGLP